MTLIETIHNAATQLSAAGISNARLDAEVLLAMLAQKDRAWLISHMHDALDDTLRETYEAVVQRRAGREPLQYIVGNQEFYGLDFFVTPDVLIPRPETELAVELALKIIGNHAQQSTIVDLCTGSGCIAVTLARLAPTVNVVAIDKSSKALKIAERNAAQHQVADRIRLLEGDLLQPLERLDIRNKVDMIVSNPPYIPSADYTTLQPEVRDFEPEMALIAGPQGTELHQRIIETAPAYLKRHGALIMEMGMGQAELLLEMIRTSDAFIAPSVYKDLAGIERVLIARKA